MLSELEWKDDILEKISSNAIQIGFRANSLQKRELLKFYKQKVLSFIETSDLGKPFKNSKIYFDIHVLVSEELSQCKIQNDYNSTITKNINDIFNKIRRENRQ